MDFTRIVDVERNSNCYRLIYFVGLLLVWLLVFAGVGTTEDGRVPNEPPKILAHKPVLDAEQVPVNGEISVVWNRPMQPNTSFAVTGPEGFIAGTFTYEPINYTVTFSPLENLSPDTRYGVMVAGQIDLEGHVQQTPYHWNFSTVTPTSVSLVSLSSGDEGLGQSWWWLSWPSLMAVVSIFSLAGFMAIWGRRRSTTLAEEIVE